MLEFIVLPFLLIIGVAWFMNFADGGGKTDKKEELRKVNNRRMAEVESNYQIEREKNPLNVEVPQTLGSENRHKEWLEARVNRFEYQFQNFDLERAKEKEPIIKNLKLYKNICSHIKKKPDKSLISEWEKMT